MEQISAATSSTRNLHLFGYMSDNTKMAKKHVKKKRGRPSSQTTIEEPPRSPAKNYALIGTLNALAAEQGLQYDDFAIKMGWYNSAGEPDGQKVGKLLTGYRFNIANIDEFCEKALGMSLIDLLILAKRTPVDGIGKLSPSQADMVAVMRDLPPSNQIALVAMGKEMRKAHFALLKATGKK